MPSQPLRVRRQALQPPGGIEARRECVGHADSVQVRASEFDAGEPSELGAQLGDQLPMLAAGLRDGVRDTRDGERFGFVLKLRKMEVEG